MKVNFFREFVSSIKYLYRSLTLSMRRKVSFDYGVMYAIVSLIVLVIFSVSFMLYSVNDTVNTVIDDVYQVAYAKDKGVFDVDELKRQVSKIAGEAEVGIYVEMTSNHPDLEPYTITEETMSDNYEGIFNMNIPGLIATFFGKSTLVMNQTRSFNYEDGKVAYYQIRVAADFTRLNGPLSFFLLVLFVAQVAGLTITSFVGSYRLRKIFRPIYNMTKTAEKISINDMNAKLDVSKAEYELKDLALTFNDMLDRIRTDYDKQKRFVSDVSHELRTPISIVNGYARMLDRWGKEDEAILEEAIDAIKGESKNMQTLVENLLTLVRSDNQTLKFEREFFKIDEMAKEIIKDMEMIDDDKHSFSHEIEAGIEVCLDYAKIKQTLRIFLDNAIKYTPEGGHIVLKVNKELNNVIISVIDTGIGVSKKDLPYLFDRFYRSDESRTRETGGHGLGLSIAKAMVIGQNGRLRVKSKENEGSEFIIVLPLWQGDNR